MSDFLVTVAGTAAVVAPLIGLQTFWVGRTLDRVDRRIDRVESQLDRIVDRLDRIEHDIVRDYGERIARLEASR